MMESDLDDTPPRKRLRRSRRSDNTDSEQAAAARERQRQRMVVARANPAARAAERERNRQRMAAVRADPVARSAERERNRQRMAATRQRGRQSRSGTVSGCRRLVHPGGLWNGAIRCRFRDALLSQLVDDLNSRTVPNLADLEELDPTIVLQWNEPRHRLNTRLLQRQVARRGKRLVVWNADHQPVQPRGGALPPPLSRLQQTVALHIKDGAFGHTTADTWYFEGARYVLLDTERADAGACHNAMVEACGLVLDPREPPDDPAAPYRRLRYLPAAVLVRPVKGHVPNTILTGLADFDTSAGAFLLKPRPSSATTIELPEPGAGTAKKRVARINVPLGDGYAVTDFYVQGMSFGDTCFVVDLRPPPRGIKRATLYVLLTRFKSMDHVRLLAPLFTNAAERREVIAKFRSATRLPEDLAAELRILRTKAAATRAKYTAEYAHAQELARRWEDEV